MDSVLAHVQTGSVYDDTMTTRQIKNGRCRLVGSSWSKVV